MPDMQRAQRILTRRYERSMTGWLDRLGEALDERGSGIHAPVLVRMDYFGTPVTEAMAAEMDTTALEIRITRYLGEGQFIIEVNDFEQEAALAADGALTIEGGGFTLTAL
jgi:hypothetical protein